MIIKNFVFVNFFSYFNFFLLRKNDKYFIQMKENTWVRNSVKNFKNRTMIDMSNYKR